VEPPHIDGVEHRYAQVGDLRVHYAEAGEGEPLILQHGWPQHWWMWRELIGPLAERYRLICPDLRGFGWSDAPPSGYRKSQLADDLLALMDRLGIERARLVGHDWGGYLGFLLCLGHPERVSRFAALSIPPPWPGPGAWRLAPMLTYQGLLASPVVGELAVRRLGLVPLLLRAGRAAGSYSEEEVETFAAPLRRAASAHASSQMYRTFLLHELLPHARGKLPAQRLTTPTLLLMGERDPLAGGVGGDYSSHADDLRVEYVPGASHFVAEERPDAVLDRLLAFL
jgi:pimeloyl-ACP methyl ester carboxylesterase